MEPAEFMFAAESALVSTKSPEKIADDRETLAPFSNALPWL
jgi:hypothetical protein